MNCRLSRSKPVDAEICLPSSKSISNRALIIRALTGENFPIANLSDCDDTRAMLAALTNRGRLIDIGAAGTAMRFLTAYLAQKQNFEGLLTGSERMKQRPIRLLVEALRSLGAEVDYAEADGFPPLNIIGKCLEGGTIELKGDVSSQYVSALMMIAPTMQHGLRIKLIPPVISEPYIALTQHLMQTFGVQMQRSETLIEIPAQYYKAREFTVESDWSAASYWYEILALRSSGSYLLKGLRPDSAQGDAEVAHLFEQLGVSTAFEADGARISAHGNVTEKMIYDFVRQPDLAQTFVVTCCFLNAPFHFSGLQTLKIKETDRIAALMAELRKFGFELTEPNDGELSWDGVRKNTTAEIVSVATYDDHRMAMSFAPIAVQQPVVIENYEVVSKSYPTFWNDLAKAEFKISI